MKTNSCTLNNKLYSTSDILKELSDEVDLKVGINREDLESFDSCSINILTDDKESYTKDINSKYAIGKSQLNIRTVSDIHKPMSKTKLFDALVIEKGFIDGYDENLIGDENDKLWLMQLTEREREMELFNRYERRECLKARFEAWKKSRFKKETYQKVEEPKNDYLNRKTSQIRHNRQHTYHHCPYALRSRSQLGK
ncbi:RNA polymerase-associated protein RTF1 like protein [Argiope bruennichi]|uniref:RNA polymerase-associated protein RTF1 like protein n=1 Tax=Argiope bruennichi TaxID=94029 RepID=A0A8T0FZW5_ARGBR|nr:RNA polymerase-associated protein RTF1 like protein [Argiope bruennichi]